MPGVYVEVGKAKFMKRGMEAYEGPAQAGLATAVTNAVRKTNSGMTTAKPSDGKGIQVNVMLQTLAQDGKNVTCKLIGDMFELPAKQRFTIPGISPFGEASVPGKIEAVAEDCVAKAVTDLMGKIGPGIAGASQQGQGSAGTATATTKSPLIYIASIKAAYTNDVNAAPQGLAVRAKPAIADAVEKKFKANPQRFTLNSNDYKPGMPAYFIEISVEKLSFDAKAGEMVASTIASVFEHPSKTMRVPRASARSKVPGLTKPLEDPDKISLMAAAAANTADTVINWMLTTHP